MNTGKEILEGITKAVKDRGTTAIAVQKALGINPNTWNQWYQRDTPPKTETLAALCEYLDIDANELLGLRKRDEKNPESLSNQEKHVLHQIKKLNSKEFWSVMNIIDAMEAEDYMKEHPEEVEDILED